MGGNLPSVARRVNNPKVTAGRSWRVEAITERSTTASLPGWSSRLRRRSGGDLEDRELGVERDRSAARRMGEVQRQASLVQNVDHCFARASIMLVSAVETLASPGTSGSVATLPFVAGS
jgi:hypothetical protein